MNDQLIWIGIVFCITQSAIFSGLNLAFFSLTRLRLEIEAEASSKKGLLKVLQLRKDSNFLLTTILWGNVGINVLLTLLSDSVLAGVASFTFSTVIITFFGEIIPQAYFSRNALKMASLLAPVLKFYQIVLYPVAKPTAIMLDRLLGKESVQFFAEKNIILFIKKHIEAYDTEIDHIEGMGAINFFSLDDLKISEGGELINPDSIIRLETKNNTIAFPAYQSNTSDPFIREINQSQEKWVIFTNTQDEPKLVLDADGFIRSVLFSDTYEPVETFCHIPIIVRDKDQNVGEILKDLRNSIEIDSSRPIEKDIILYWGSESKRIITGADILGRLFKGI